MTEEEKEKIVNDLEDRTSFIIDVDEIGGEEGIKKFGKGFYIGIWFNDMFAWALSYAVSFIPKNRSTLEDTIKEFNTWYDKEGKIFKERFDAVPYPCKRRCEKKCESKIPIWNQIRKFFNNKKIERDYWNDVENYFSANCIIGNDLIKSVNAYCGQKINDEDLVYTKEEK